MENKPNSPLPAKTSRGRPRAFDRDAALQKALALFIDRGYEGTSIADLVSEMNITPPSLYAAFGSKEDLFRETVGLFFQKRGRFVGPALEEEDSAKDVIHRILHDAAKSFTPTKGEVPGCLISAQLVACNPSNHDVAHYLKELRSIPVTAIIQRLELAKKEGELPASVNCKSLARFYAAVVTGMAVQARDGASRRELLECADNAMRAWPGKE